MKMFLSSVAPLHVILLMVATACAGCDSDKEANDLDAFIQKFEKDGEGALADFTDKTVKLSGKVRYVLDVDQNVRRGDAIHVASSGDKTRPYVVCNTKKNYPLAELPDEGDSITITGRPDKYHAADDSVPMRIGLVDCTPTFGEE
jgi:hypothetical protein